MHDLTLHIGLHKTGTTFLQHMVLKNRALLADADLMPAPWLHPQEDDHYPLLAALWQVGTDPARLKALAEEIDRAPGEQLLVSAEELSWYVERTDHASRLLEALAARFRVRVLIFLRRQDYLKESMFAHVVKSWYCGDIRDEHHYDYDHASRLNRLAALFGEAALRVALFRDGKPNDLMGAFLAALGLTLDRSRLEVIPPINVSMHRRQVLFMAQFPKPTAARRSREGMKCGRRLARILRASEAIADDGRRYMLSPRERHDLVASHTAGNRALVERFAVADPGALLALPNPDTPWTPPAPIAAEERAARGGFWTWCQPGAALRDTLRFRSGLARMGSAG
jgi:hypothetical protein